MTHYIHVDPYTCQDAHLTAAILAAVCLLWSLLLFAYVMLHCKSTCRNTGNTFGKQLRFLLPSFPFRTILLVIAYLTFTIMTEITIFQAKDYQDSWQLRLAIGVTSIFPEMFQTAIYALCIDAWIFVGLSLFSPFQQARDRRRLRILLCSAGFVCLSWTIVIAVLFTRNVITVDGFQFLYVIYFLCFVVLVGGLRVYAFWYLQKGIFRAAHETWVAITKQSTVAPFYVESSSMETELLPSSERKEEMTPHARKYSSHFVATKLRISAVGRIFLCLLTTDCIALVSLGIFAVVMATNNIAETNVCDVYPWFFFVFCDVPYSALALWSASTCIRRLTKNAQNPILASATTTQA